MMHKSFDISRDEHPVQKEIRKVVGSYQLAIDITIDTDTLAKLGHIKGLVALIAEVRRNGVVIGEGRGTAVLNRQNRFIERTVHSAFNSALLGAVAQSTKALDALVGYNPSDTGDSVEAITDEGITDKQKSYLFELIQTNVADEDERNRWQSQIDGLTKDEASEAIQSFKR